MNSDDLSSIPFIILAGGLGTRLQTILPDLPKALAPIGDKPFLSLLIDMLRKRGAHHFVLCLGYAAEKVIDHINEISDSQSIVEISVEKIPMGTAGAIKLAANYLKPRAFVLNGDTYLDMDYAAMLEYHINERSRYSALATIAVADSSRENRFGNIVIDENERGIIEFNEKTYPDKGTSYGVNGGVYVVERQLVDLIPDTFPVSLERDILPFAIRQGLRLSAFRTGKEFFDIGTPESLLSFSRHYLEMVNAGKTDIDAAANS